MTAARGEPHGRLGDAALAVSVTLVIALVVALDSAGAPSLGGMLCAAGFGAVLLLRRRFPTVVLIVTILGIFVYYAIGLPPIGMVLPTVGALYSAAEMRRILVSVIGAAVLIAVSSFFRLDDPEPQAALIGYSFVTELALAAAAIALGAAVSLARSTRAQSARIAALTAAEEVHAAEVRMQSEQVRIARDLHDTIGHTLSVASLHASVASESTDPDETEAALTQVRSATSEALRELRRTVKVLRAEAAGATSAPASALGLASLRPVFDAARSVGVDVIEQIDVDAGALSRAVDAAAFRIIQESVTNVIRHAGASRVAITARRTLDALEIDVADDGSTGSSTPTGPPAASEGAGIRGMSERAELLGGTLTASPDAAGFAVHARIPINDDGARPSDSQAHTENGPPTDPPNQRGEE